MYNAANSGIVLAVFPRTEEEEEEPTENGAPYLPNVPAPDFSVDISGLDAINSLPVTIDMKSKSTTVNLMINQEEIFNTKQDIVVTVPAIPEMDRYTLILSADILSSHTREGRLIFNSNEGSICLPAGLLEEIPDKEEKEVEIIIARVDDSVLTKEAKTAIGNRPLIQLEMTLDGNHIDWRNSGAPVTVSIPYTPTEQELENPEAIVIWYIEENGNLVSVPDGHYNPETGTVSFTTTHSATML